MNISLIDNALYKIYYYYHNYYRWHQSESFTPSPSPRPSVRTQATTWWRRPTSPARQSATPPWWWSLLSRRPRRRWRSWRWHRRPWQSRRLSWQDRHLSSRSSSRTWKWGQVTGVSLRSSSAATHDPRWVSESFLWWWLCHVVHQHFQWDIINQHTLTNIQYSVR